MINPDEKVFDANTFGDAISPAPKRSLKNEDSVGFSPSKKHKQSLPLLSGSNITMNSPDPLSKHHNCNEIQIKFKKNIINEQPLISSRKESNSNDKSNVGVSPTLFYILNADHDKENSNVNVRHSSFIRRPIKNITENRKEFRNNYKYREESSVLSSLGSIVLGSTSFDCDSGHESNLANNYSVREQVHREVSGIAVIDTDVDSYSNYDITNADIKDSPSSVAEMPYDDYTCINSYQTNGMKLPIPLHSYSSPTLLSVCHTPISTTTSSKETGTIKYHQHQIAPSVVNLLSNQPNATEIPISNCVKDGARPTPPITSNTYNNNRGSSKTPINDSSTTTTISNNNISTSTSSGISSTYSPHVINSNTSNHSLNPIILTKTNRDSLNSLTTNINNIKKKDGHQHQQYYNTLADNGNELKEEEDEGEVADNFIIDRTIVEVSDTTTNIIEMKLLSSSLTPPTLLPGSLEKISLHNINATPPTVIAPPHSNLKRINSNKTNKGGRPVKNQSTKLANSNSSKKTNSYKHNIISPSSDESPLEFLHKNNCEVVESDDSEFDVLSLTHEFNLLTVDHSSNNSNSYELLPSTHINTTTTTSSSSSTTMTTATNISNLSLLITITDSTSTISYDTILVPNITTTTGDADDNSDSEKCTDDENDVDLDTNNLDVDVASGTGSTAVTYGNFTPEKCKDSRPKTHHSRMKRIKRRSLGNSEESPNNNKHTAVKQENIISSNMIDTTRNSVDLIKEETNKDTVTQKDIIKSENNKVDVSLSEDTDNTNTNTNTNTVTKERENEADLCTVNENTLGIDTTSNSNSSSNDSNNSNNSSSDSNNSNVSSVPSTPPGKAPVSMKEAVVAIRRKQANHGTTTRRKKVKLRSKMRRTYYYPKLESLLEGVVMSHGFPAWLLDVSVVSSHNRNPFNEEGNLTPGSSNSTQDSSSSSSSSSGSTGSTSVGTTTNRESNTNMSISPPPNSSLMNSSSDASFSSTTTFNATSTSSNNASAFTNSKLSLNTNTTRLGKRQLAPLQSQRGQLVRQPIHSHLHPTPLLSGVSLSSAVTVSSSLSISPHSLITNNRIIDNHNVNDTYSNSSNSNVNSIDKALSPWYREQCNDIWKSDSSCYQSGLPNDHRDIELELFRAILTRNINRMIAILNSCDNYVYIINLIEENHGNSFLIIATQQDWKKGVRLLLKRGANVNIQNKYGNTALHFACQFGFKEIEKYLRKKGALAHLCNCKNIDCSI